VIVNVSKKLEVGIHRSRESIFPLQTEAKSVTLGDIPPREKEKTVPVVPSDIPAESEKNKSDENKRVYPFSAISR
jgi:hypothetical protein